MADIKLNNLIGLASHAMRDCKYSPEDIASAIGASLNELNRTAEVARLVERLSLPEDASYLSISSLDTFRHERLRRIEISDYVIRGNWEEEIAYEVDDAVLYVGLWYKSLTAHTGQEGSEPDTNTTDYELITHPGLLTLSEKPVDFLSNILSETPLSGKPKIFAVSPDSGHLLLYPTADQQYQLTITTKPTIKPFSLSQHIEHEFRIPDEYLWDIAYYGVPAKLWMTDRLKKNLAIEKQAMWDKALVRSSNMAVRAPAILEWTEAEYL